MLYWDYSRGKGVGRSTWVSTRIVQVGRRNGWGEKRTLTWCLLALMLLLTTPTWGQPELADLVQELNLSDYPSGMWPPPFKGQTVNGRAISLADFQGRVVLVNFWATWCIECRAEMPLFERLHQDFAVQGLVVLGVNVREEAQHIKGYAKKHGLSFPLIMDPNGEIFRPYGVVGLPTTFVVGRDGRPVALAVGARAWGSAEARAFLQLLLAESGAN